MSGKSRRANPIREEDILEVAMERFWAAEGGNQEGVKAVLKFARAVFLDLGDEACANIASENAENDSRGDSPFDNGSGSCGYRKACYDIEEAIRARASSKEA